MQLNIARTLFVAVSLTKRNLLEVSVVLFIICIATQVRALTGDQVSGVGKREMVA